MNKSTSKNATEMIIMGADDSRLSRHDSQIMNHLEALLAFHGFAYINIRRIFVTNGEIDTPIRTSIDHTYVTIDLITKDREEISDEMYRDANEFVLNTFRKDIKLNVFEAANAMEKIIDDVINDKVSASNLIRCISMRIIHTVDTDERFICSYIGNHCSNKIRKLSK